MAYKIKKAKVKTTGFGVNWKKWSDNQYEINLFKKDENEWLLTTKEKSTGKYLKERVYNNRNDAINYAEGFMEGI